MQPYNLGHKDWGWRKRWSVQALKWLRRPGKKRARRLGKAACRTDEQKKGKN